MAGVKLLCFLVILPVLACLGHDGYLYYLNREAGNGLPFQLSDLGWMWVTYSPESFALVKESVDPGTWNIVNLILERSGAILFGVIAAVVYLVLGVLWMFGLWPFATLSAVRGFERFGEQRKKNVRYNRK